MIKQISYPIIVFILSAFPCVGYGINIQECLKFISKKDQLILEEFFSYMISYEYFGYVLFGEKPMAAGGFDTHFTLENILSEEAAKQCRLRIGWQTWEKYASLFVSEKFILRLSKNPVSPSFYWVVLINKDSCLKCIESNLEIFKSVLGNSISPRWILDKLATKEDIFGEVLNKHEGLLGILFGYGVHNAMTFQQQNKMSKATKRIYSNGKKSTMLATKLSPFNRFNRDLIRIDLPRFAEDPNHPDSFRLRTLYESNWKQLAQIYSGKNFLELTIMKLMERQ